MPVDGSRIAYGNRLWSAANAVTNEYAASSLIQYTSILRASQMLAHPSGSAHRLAVPSGALRAGSLRSKLLRCISPNLPSEAELLRCISSPREITHDLDGNMLSDGVLSITYDAANRLKTVSSNGVLLVTNFYDAKSRRVKKVTPEATMTFFYDGWNLIEERVAHTNGTTTTIRYFWGKDLSGTLQGAGGVGSLLAVSIDGAFYIPCYDHNGNVVCYVAESGTIAAQYVYDPYGSVVDSYGDLADVFNFGFSTKYHDRETGMASYQQRFLIPTIGRWLNRDPIEEDGGVNLYGFCGNSPICNHDKNGCAYFAVRKLKGSPDIMPWSTFFVCPFMKIAADFAADALNVELVHEQLFFEDSGHDLSNVGWGTDKNGREKRLENEPKNGYTRRDGGYDDCIMRIAVGEVNPTHYQLTWVGSKSKCNCQDYADALRTKYRELSNDPNVKCKCKKGK